MQLAFLTHTHTLFPSLHGGDILDLTTLMCLADQCLMLVAIKVSIRRTETAGFDGSSLMQGQECAAFKSKLH